jgi:hypothetical protein
MTVFLLRGIARSRLVQHHSHYVRHDYLPDRHCWETSLSQLRSASLQCALSEAMSFASQLNGGRGSRAESQAEKKALMPETMTAGPPPKMMVSASL